jgi:hypothetical protein
MMHGKKILTLLCPAMLACGLSVQAATLDSLDVHGSISATASYSDKYGFMGDTADNLDVNLIDIILNSTHRFENGLRIGGQIYAFKLGSYKDLTLDFASADYSFNQRFGVRVGRNKLPHGLYNDSQDLDAIRTFASLPFSFYPRSLRVIDASFDGLTLYGTFDLGQAGSLDYQLFAGAKETIKGADTPLLRGVSYSLIKFNEWKLGHGINGVSLFWNLPVEGLKLGYSLQQGPKTRMQGVLGATNVLHGQDLALAGLVDTMLGAGTWDYSGMFAGTPAGVNNVDVLFRTISAEYTHGRWIFAGEYKLVDQLHGLTSVPALALLGQPTSSPYTNNLLYYYGSISFEASDRIGLGYYYAQNSDKRQGTAAEKALPENFSKDHCFAISYKVTKWCVAKAEYHFMDGLTPLTLSGDRNDVSTITGSSRWNYLVLKTTVSF